MSQTHDLVETTVQSKMDFVFSNISPTSSFGGFTLFVAFTATVFLFLQVRRFLFSGPGPWGLPLVGFYPFLRPDFHVHFAELAKTYGDPYFVTLGGKLYLHISSHRTIREVFSKNADSFPSRCQGFGVHQYLFEHGAIVVGGEKWKLWRKFISQSLRELGLGPREQLKGPMLDSLQAILTSLKQSNGQSIDIGTLLNLECTQVVRRLMLGEKVSLETALKINKSYFKSHRIMGGPANLLCGNITRYLMMPWIKGFHELLESKQELESLFRPILNDHKINFNSKPPEDLIDLYLREKKIREERGDPQAKYLNDEIFLSNLFQVYGDGGFLIGTFITCYLKDLASKPDVQDAIYKEIVSEIGMERFPTYEDRNKLPFTNSVLKEIERISTFFPIIPGTVSNCDVTISGLNVPKGTTTIVNFYAINKDPAVYKKPERFDPYRFMPDDTGKRSEVELPITFGLGRRSCPGEPLVTTELFVFVTSIVQHFILRLEKVPERQNKGMDFTEVYNYKFSAVQRKSSHI